MYGQTRRVWRPSPLDEKMPVPVVSSSYLHIRYIALTTKSDAGPANRQPLFSSRQDGYIHSATLLESQDHSRALRSAINRLPPDWQRPRGSPQRTRLSTITLDLQHHNRGLNPAWKRVQDCFKWRYLWRRLGPIRDVPPDDDDDDDDTYHANYRSLDDTPINFF